MPEHSSPTTAGFSLVETIVALTVFSIIAAGTLKVLSAARSSYADQVQKLRINNDLRVGMAFLESEFKGLNTTDSAGSDIISLTNNSVEYLAVRGIGFVCADVPAGSTQLPVWKTPWFGERRPRTESDSLLLYAGGEWLRRNLIAVGTTDQCEDGEEGFRLRFDRSVPGLPLGTPLRIFQVNRIRLYRTDDWWLGMARRRKSGAWTRTQPFLGPMDRNGFLVEANLRSDAIASLNVRLIAKGAGGQVDSLSALFSTRNGLLR